MPGQTALVGRVGVAPSTTHPRQLSTHRSTHRPTQPRWPVDASSKRILEFCTTEHLNPASLAGFEPSLRFYLRPGNAADDATSFKFWDHEWQRHGTCSNMVRERPRRWVALPTLTLTLTRRHGRLCRDRLALTPQDQLSYFLAVFRASAAADPAAALRAAGLFPSNLQPYTLKQACGTVCFVCQAGFGAHCLWLLPCQGQPGNDRPLLLAAMLCRR